MMVINTPLYGDPLAEPFLCTIYSLRSLYKLFIYLKNSTYLPFFSELVIESQKANRKAAHSISLVPERTPGGIQKMIAFTTILKAEMSFRRSKWTLIEELLKLSIQCFLRPRSFAWPHLDGALRKQWMHGQITHIHFGHVSDECPQSRDSRGRYILHR